MRRIFSIIMAFAILLAVAWTVRAADFNAVVVISIDALHPDALTRANAPRTCAMLDKGVLTMRGRSTDPPQTLIAHSAMISGKGPEAGGRQSNDWSDGETSITGRTIFHAARDRGYRTGLFYSKPKLGFLNNEAVNAAVLSRDDAVGKAVRFLESAEPSFAFVHVSGLDVVGPESGWLSPAYCEELSYIDDYLGDIYRLLERKGNYLLFVTSDHGGYEKQHGGSHPEEARLPFGIVSDRCSFPALTDAEYVVTDLPGILEKALDCQAKP